MSDAMHWIDRYAAGVDEECQLDRVAAALGARQWRPIETVPQGVIVLMCNMKAGEVRNWAFVDWMVDGKCCGNRFHEPTHWQPLPAPPNPSTT